MLLFLVDFGGPTNLTRKYFDYLQLSKCREEMMITNLPNKRTLVWIFFHDYVEFAVVQSRRNHEDGNGYRKLDSERCIRASKSLDTHDQFKNFLLLFKAAALGRMRRQIKETNQVAALDDQDASSWQIQDVPGEPGLDYCIDHDIAISIDISEIHILLGWEDRIDNLWHGEFEAQICMCSRLNLDVPPRITLMEALTGAKDIPDLSDPGSDSDTAQ